MILPSFQSRGSFQAISLACLAISTAKRIKTTQDASAAKYLVEDM
jgi:hypothetical protein